MFLKGARVETELGQVGSGVHTLRSQLAEKFCAAENARVQKTRADMPQHERLGHF